MPFWLGIQKIGREWKNEENGEKKTKNGKKDEILCLLVRDKEKRGEKERKRKKGEKEREKRNLVWGAGVAYYAFLVRIYIKSGEKEKRGKR